MLSERLYVRGSTLQKCISLSTIKSETFSKASFDDLECRAECVLNSIVVIPFLTFVQKCRAYHFLAHEILEIT